MIFVGSLLAPVTLTCRLARAHQPYWLLLAGLAWATVAGYVGIQYLARNNKGIDWFLSVAMLNLLLLTPELLLRQINFHYETGVQFGYPNPAQFESFVPDEDLFWKLPPDRPGVNSLGFWGEEIEMPKPPGVYRIMFLGDSVPRQGYPKIMENLLNEQNRPAIQFESANLAIAGYTTYQGRILTDRYGEILKPDLVVVSYGWNDHWQAYGNIDSKKTITVPRSFTTGRFFQTVYHYSRVWQWLRYMLASLFGAEGPLAVVRVPAAEYRDNLTYIGQYFSARGAPVIYLTSPSAHLTLGVPDYLVARGFAPDKKSVVTLHQTYNQIAREVAITHNWFILDLEQEFALLDNLPEIFIEDGIHLTPAGSALVARRITEFILANLQLVPSRSNALRWNAF